MNKTVMTTILFLVLTLLFAGQAQAALVIGDLTPTLLSGNVSQTLTANFTLENTGAVEVKATISFDKFTITNKGSIPASAFTSSPSPLVSVPAGQKANVSFTVTIPANTFSGTYNGEMSATDSADASNKDTVGVGIFVNEKPSFSASTPAKKIILQGKNDVLVLNLTNTGNNDLTDVTATLFDLVSGSNKISAANSMIKVTAEPVSLVYDNTKQSTKEYQVRVFVDAAQTIGTYTGDIIFKSAKTTDVKTTVSVEVQSVVEAVTLSATSGQMKVKNNGIVSNTPITLTIANTGNTDQDVTVQTVTLTSGANSLTITPDKTTVSVKAGQSTTVTYTANTAAVVGSYTGVITGTYSNGKTANANAQYSVAEATSNTDFPTIINLPSTPADKGTEVTAEFTFKNTGDTSLTNMVLATKNLDNALYDVKFSTDGNFFANPLNLGSINKDQSLTIKVKGKVPGNEQPGLHKIGDVVLTTTELTRTSTLQLNVKSFLSIKEVKMEFDSSKDSVTVNHATIDNSKAKPGAQVSLNVEVCNKFTADNNKIKDIVVEATWIGIDDGEDIEGESNSFDLSEVKCKPVSIDLDQEKIPYFVDQTTYYLLIEVEGDDKNDTTHKDTWTVPVQINKESEPEMKIFEAKLSPLELSCEGTISLDVIAYNVGEDSNDDGRFTITSPLLGINYVKDMDFGSDADDDCDAIDEPDEQCLGFDHTFTFDIENDVAPGKYAINLKTFHDDTNEDDARSVDLTVKACGGQQAPPAQTTPAPQPVPQPGTTVTPTPEPAPNVSSQPVVVFTQQPAATSAPAQASPPTRIVDLTQTLDTNNTYLLLLVIANVLLLVLLFVAIAKAVRR